MRRHLIGALAACGILLGAGAGTAAADASTQAVEQAAGTSQSATSSASSTQVAPSNSNISVRIGSPGNNGSVTQSNSSTAASAAANAAKTTQAATQAGGGSGVQAAGQKAGTDQTATSDATSKQVAPSNSNISVRIGSPGDDGDVSQSNSSTALSLAANAAKTDQAVAQSQDSCCTDGNDGKDPKGDKDPKDGKDGHGSGAAVQAAEQKAATEQSADSSATSEQIKPSNSNTPVRIFSKGNNGSVTQSNDSTAKSLALNAAATHQAAMQTQHGCDCKGDRVQAVGQFAWTDQDAKSDATSKQIGATNKNTPVRIKSDGDDGDVSQSNSSTALSAAINLAKTEQAVAQSQDGCDCPDGKRDGHGSGAGVQAIGQFAGTEQDAHSSATSWQFKPTNSNAPVRIKSMGGGGSVEQSNDSLAKSLALNLALTRQLAHQRQ